ncbi:MAG: hypothetical protein J7L96_02290 [Bacteroidales bacterium]|nr:hypothetical protein [Bacteroidales bacterium]
MDDFIIINNDKKILRGLLEKATGFIEDELKLKMNPKTDIFPASHGIDFCGYRIWTTHILPRKRIIRHARKHLVQLAENCSAGKIPLETVRQSIMSFLGYMKHCNGYKTTKNILSEAVIRRNKNGIRNKY